MLQASYESSARSSFLSECIQVDHSIYNSYGTDQSMNNSYETCQDLKEMNSIWVVR